MKRVLLFGGVGVGGALVHMGGFKAFQAILGVGNSAAWLLAFFAAATFTWALNRTLTFADKKTANSSGEWLKYLVVAGCGAVAHFIVFAAAVGFIPVFAQNPAFAIIPGSLASFVVTYIGATLLVFRTARNSP
jgi:putative flippase GtrA